MWHYDAYHQLAHGVGPISRRPDLIGRATTGEWIAVEAKGRTRGWTDELQTSAKTQARTISEIVHPGSATDQVDANVASITYFDGDGWNLLMDDPPSKPQPLRLASSLRELFGVYYQPLLAYIGAALEAEQAESVLIDGAEFKVVYDADLDLFVGVAAIVIETEGIDIDVIRSALADVAPTGEVNVLRTRRMSDDAGRTWSVGADGVIARLGERWQ